METSRSYAAGGGFYPPSGTRHIPRIRDELEQFTVLYARPTGLGNSHDDMSGKLPSQVLRETFVEEQSHSAGLGRFFNHCVSRLLQQDDGLFAGNGRILF